MKKQTVMGEIRELKRKEITITENWKKTETEKNVKQSGYP